MSSRGTGLKLTLLALPFAAWVLSLHAFGEPAGRAARAASAALTYPEYVHGPWRIRDRRGSGYHNFAAKTLNDFAAPLSAWAAALGVVQPSRVDVWLLDTREDLERFGVDPRRLEGDGLADAAAGLIAIVSEGRTHNPDQDARSLRHWMTHLLLAPTLDRVKAGPWAVIGLASCFETAAPGAPLPGPRRAESLPIPLAVLLEAPAADFQGASSARYAEGARLWTAFLLDQKPAELLRWLRGDPPGTPDRFAACFGDRQDLEIQWKDWLARPTK